MTTFTKPKIIVSRCLGFEACRWDGGIILSEAVEELYGNVEYITICPEIEIGLGVPRNPINLYEDNGNVKVIQEGTGLEITESLRRYSHSIIENHPDVKGYILKSNSPSCGYQTSKIISGEVTRTASGIFAETVSNEAPDAIIVDEESLKKAEVRERFLRMVSSR